MSANITRVRRRVEAARASAALPPWINPEWTPLPGTWPPMVIQRLRRNGVETWQQLERLTEADALGWVGVGRDTVVAIRKLCAEAGRFIQRAVVSGGVAPGPQMVMPVRLTILPIESKCGVYFIQCGSFIKIGVSVNVVSRLKSLAFMNPYALVGLGFIRAADDAWQVETGLHQRFAECRHRGEWFHDSEALRAYIRENARPWPEAQ